MTDCEDTGNIIVFVFFGYRKKTDSNLSAKSGKIKIICLKAKKMAGKPDSRPRPNILQFVSRARSFMYCKTPRFSRGSQVVKGPVELRPPPPPDIYNYLPRGHMRQ